MPEEQARSARMADFTFRAGSLVEDELRVTGFSGTEGISELFHFHVDVCSDRSDIALEEIVGKGAVLEISGAHGSRFVNAIVRRFEACGQSTNVYHYAADLVPVHWLLTRRYKSRIFQEHNCSDMTVPGIIKKVLEDAGIPEANYRFALQGSYEKREYVVQYREPEMDFISRLMEEEGIFYFFEHAADGHKMVFGDSTVAHAATPNESQFAFREKTGMVTEASQEFIYHLRDRQEIQTGAVALDDYNFQQPPQELMATSTADQYTSLEYYDYPGRYVAKSVGDHYAQVRLEEFQWQRHTYQMSTAVRALLPGFKFELKEHPTEALNQEYVVTRLTHRAYQPQSAQDEASVGRGMEYNAEVQTIPANVPYRPRRVTPKPVVHGSQTALVVGPSGEEIWPDKYGRVKVHFHWDREGQHDENASRWIRVNQGLAGGQYGMMFLPRVGQEVVVDFLEGDPDRPLITGRVYNNDNMPPYTLPDEKTKSTIKTHSSKGGGGTNEIRFEDAKDSEQILVYAQKDLHVRVNNDRVENVDNNRHLTVKKDKFELVKEKKHVEVKLDHNEKIGGKMSLKVTGDVGEEIGGKHSEKTSGDIYLKSDSNVIIEAGTALTLKVSGNFVKIDTTGVTVYGSMTKINSGGSAGTGSAVSLTTPEATEAADSATPGSDVTYQAAPVEAEAIEAPPGEFEPVEATEEEQETSWIEIELVDEEGNPVPGELYEITGPEGRVRRGNLDANGQAHVGVREPGTCEVSFPNLDEAAWEDA
jgi:type VI secretion system secreted protein VgrG